jgi:hypothetical protein
VILLLLAACRAAPAKVGGAAIAPLSSLPTAYLPAFKALETAVEEHEDQVARGILDQLRSRLLVDRARLQAQAERTTEAPSRERSLELEQVQSALHTARAFDRILVGRALVEGLQLELAATPSADGRSASLSLRASGSSDSGAGPIVLAPGPGTLTVQIYNLSPEGNELHSAWTTSTQQARELVVGAGGVTELPLGNYPLVVPPDILATPTSARSTPSPSTATARPRTPCCCSRPGRRTIRRRRPGTIRRWPGSVPPSSR